MALRDDLLPTVEDLHGIAGELGFRQYQVFVRVTKFTGARPGIGASSSTTTRLLVNRQNPKVREVSSSDRVAGNNAMTSGEYEIGPLTPGYVPQGVFSPESDGQATQVHYILKGPGFPPEGELCQKTSDHQDRPLRIMIRVKSIGKKAT